MLDTIIKAASHIHWQDYVTKFSTILTFLAAALICYLLQAWKNPRQINLKSLIAFTLPPAGWKSTSSSMDILIYLISRLFGALFAFGEIAAMLWLAHGLSNLLSHIFVGHAPTAAGYFDLLVWSVLIFIVQDFAKFWGHYLDHKIPALWELHKVHHSATFLSPLTTARRHPLGDKMDAIWWVLLLSIPAGLARFLYAVSDADILIMLANATLISTVLILDPLRHSHLPISFGPLDHVLVSPHMHQLHHSVKVEHWDKNMGDKLFIWDRMFGTGYIPPRDEVLEFGIGRGEAVDQIYTTAWGVFVTPVANAIKVLRHGPLEQSLPVRKSSSAAPILPAQTQSP